MSGAFSGEAGAIPLEQQTYRRASVGTPAFAGASVSAVEGQLTVTGSQVSAGTYCLPPSGFRAFGVFRGGLTVLTSQVEIRGRLRPLRLKTWIPACAGMTKEESA